MLDLFLLVGEARASFSLSKSVTFLNCGDDFFLDAPDTLVLGLVDLAILVEDASLFGENAFVLWFLVFASIGPFLLNVTRNWSFFLGFNRLEMTTCF